MDSLWWKVLALWLVLEGLGPALFPGQWRRFLFELSQQKTSTLRQIGVVLVLLGGAIVVMVKN
ncbi:DUF2065 domain-containing protein [Gallaecimonas sp. GXIMD4217]|uniref:DUF2065 domain-containing protein n=1 Tax=Gallaecimonas sp. GXIMD4217 TaxID=3131927 RepID=UPI00311B0942